MDNSILHSPKVGLGCGEVPKRGLLPQTTQMKMSQNQEKTSRKSRHLTDPVVKELLEDIKSQGGLEVFNLDSVCQSKPDIYGNKHNFPLLKAVRNCVQDFKLRPLYYESKQLQHLGTIFDSISAMMRPAVQMSTLLSKVGVLNIT